jgi:DNA gyrase/topoisomerase IV subunit A
MAEITFNRVKEILDNSIKLWEEENQREAKLKASHQAELKWGAREELMKSAPYDLTLVEEDKVGNDRAEETNLIKILRRNIGGYRRMPSRGPYIPDDQIEEIVEWINAGAPD